MQVRDRAIVEEGFLAGEIRGEPETRQKELRFSIGQWMEGFSCMGMRDQDTKKL
jgi:hypothetical protein